MMIKSKKYSELLTRVDFPLYTVQCLTEWHILAAGGGGRAKTGIRNAIEIYELINSGKSFRAECVCRYETGSEAIMNCTAYDAGKYFLLFAGSGGHCSILKIRYEEKTCNLMGQEGSEKDISSVPKRPLHLESNMSEDQAPDVSSKLVFQIQLLDTFQTDFSDEPFQKLVRFSPKEELLVTGGADGHVRFWKHPKFHQIIDIPAHNDDVDDIDMCPLGKMVVSVSREGHGKVWSTANGTLLTELSYPSLSDCLRSTKYVIRSCRFAVVSHSCDLALFCSFNPSVRKKQPLKSYLCKWDVKDDSFSEAKSVSTGCDMLSTLCVTDDGNFLALGTQSGCVKMYLAFSLQCIYSIDFVHNIFITCINFLPNSGELCRITGKHEASLVSVSVDNQILIHHIPDRGRSMSFPTLMTMFVLTLFFVFVIMDFFNL